MERHGKRPVNPLRDPRAALRFVLEFAQTDLDAASVRKRATIERRLHAFTNRQSPWEWDHPWDDRTLRENQRRALELLRAVARGGPIAISGTLSLGFGFLREPRGLRLLVMAAPHPRFVYELVRVVESAGHKLTACPALRADGSGVCGRLFLRVTRKRFCSSRCQMRDYMRKYRAGEVGGEA